MAHDDPKKRIVDLERRLTEQHRGAELRKRNRILLSTNVPAVVVALAAAMLVIVISACGTNTLSGSTHSVRVPAVKGQSSADAIATLQNQGFKVRRLQKPDSTVAPDHVIDTHAISHSSLRIDAEFLVPPEPGQDAQRENEATSPV